MAVPKVSILANDVTHAHVLAASGQGLATREVFLGRLKSPETKLAKLVRFVNFLGDVPAPPASKTWLNDAAKASISKMYGNDQYGDCVIASEFHGIGLSSANETGTAIVGTTTEALSEYVRICGPGDNGCYIPDVKNACLGQGILIGGKKRKIDGFAAVDPANKLAVQTAILISGGGFNIGFNVPAEWMGANTYDGAVWDVPHSFSFVGGHDIRAVGYDSRGVQFATWGIVVTMTWAAMADSRIVDEAYIELEEDWDTDGTAPSGLKTVELKAAIDAYNAGNVPDWTPGGGPTPPEPPTPPTPGTITLTGEAQTQDEVIQMPGILRPHNVTVHGQKIPLSVSGPLPGSGSDGRSVTTDEIYAELKKRGVDAESLERGKINPVVVADFIALALAFMSKDPVAIAAALAKLLADLQKP